MENMKMSDVWNKTLTYGVYDNATVAGNTLPRGFGMLFNNEEPAKAVVHAVNNHDRLAEENAELREFAKYCQGFLGCEEARDSMALHGITIKAKELLNK